MFQVQAQGFLSISMVLALVKLYMGERYGHVYSDFLVYAGGPESREK